MPPFQVKPIAPERVEGVQLRGPARVGKQKGRAGDWLVTRAGGELVILSAAAFAATFEPVSPNGDGGGGGTGKPSAGRRPEPQGSRPQKGPVSTAPAKRRGKLSDETWAEIKVAYEHGDKVTALAKAAGITDAAIYAHAKAGKWKRPKAPKGGTPTARTGEKLPGRVRCTSCSMWTEYDPCESCGNKLKRNW